MNVTLIGMAGAGKSYIGKKLAEVYALDFIDTDVLLEEKYKKSIQALLEEVGERDYLEHEAKMIIEATRNRANFVLAPGGSIIYHGAGMDQAKDMTTVVYLRVPFQVVEERLKDAPPRAIIGLGQKSLRELYDERHPLYEMNADLILDTQPLSLEEVIEKIATHLGVDRAAEAAKV